MQLRLLLIALTLALLPSLSFAQKVTVSGTVCGPDSGSKDKTVTQNSDCKPRYSPVANVVVMITPEKSPKAVVDTFTDSRGHYSLAVEAGRYMLRTDSDLYQSFSKQLNVDSSSQGQSENIHLKAQINAARAKDNCTVPNYGDLSTEKQKEVFYLGIDELWNKLPNRKRLMFFNIIGAIKRSFTTEDIHNDELKVDLQQGLRVHLDRVYFVGAHKLFEKVDKHGSGFTPDVGRGSSHPEYENSYRQNRFYKPLQLSFTVDRKLEGQSASTFTTSNPTGENKVISQDVTAQANQGQEVKQPHNGLEADLDIFNPNWNGGFGVGLLLHGLEVGVMHRITKLWGWGGLTDSYSVSQRKDWECIEGTRR